MNCVLDFLVLLLAVVASIAIEVLIQISATLRWFKNITLSLLE